MRIRNQKNQTNSTKTKEKRTGHTNKQTSDQTSKQTNKQRNEKNKEAVSPVFFLVRCNGWSNCVRPNETNKKTTGKQSREPTQTHELYM